MKIIKRPRRLRVNPVLRDLVAETVFDNKKLIMPYFVSERKNFREPIKSMPGIETVSLNNLIKDLEKDYKKGIKNILLFGLPLQKDDLGSGAYAKNGIIQKAVKKIKKEFPEINLITDVCLCEYTLHGHCGEVSSSGQVLNDQTLKLLEKISLSHAEAGADLVAPSDMMDGRVAAIRQALDQKGFEEIGILSYAAKYSSAFYGPFREAVNSAPLFGDRSTYQMDYRNSLEAEKEIFLDIEEGADIIMVKPALSYLDIIAQVRAKINLPLCAYNVSGEYSLVKIAAQQGLMEERKAVLEILTSIFRAGANMVVSYHTRDIFVKKWL